MPESFPRVMWLLNHGAARQFEVPMLKAVGFTEIFLPKNYPQELSFRSANVDRSEDVNLSIPKDDLAVLNTADWHHGPDRDTWDLANKYFDVLFFSVHDLRLIRVVAKYFRGAIILRGYGLERGKSYTAMINLGARGDGIVERLGRRFWFGTAYRNISSIESPILQEREIYLPAGLQDCDIRHDWNGSDPAVFIVCPDVIGNDYYRRLYELFKTQLAGFRYAVGGAQALPSSDPAVLGWVPDEQHRRNMREFRVMFYNSTEPNHVHYHPFEAVRAGMPLVFLAGGMLDRLGGIGLPGRCRTLAEARSKLRRILSDDQKLIQDIRASQVRLLDSLKPAKLEPAWREGLTRVVSELKQSRAVSAGPSRRARIAVILPLAYRGGTLRSAILLAQALWTGSRLLSEDVDVVFAYPDASGDLRDRSDEDLSPNIKRRSIEWQRLDSASARRAMNNAGHPDWAPSAATYLVPDDGVQHLCDCDLWIVVSDRLSSPLLPICPYILVVFDYLQRYVNILPAGGDQPFLSAARNAERVLVTTRFTEQDALVYAGLAKERVCRVPMLVPNFAPVTNKAAAGSTLYFLWTTNLAPHKNHYAAILALREYYEQLDGQYECRVSGVNTGDLLTSDFPHLKPLASLVARSEILARRIHLLGELPEASYRQQLSHCSFLWHPTRIDNGTLSVVEAAHLGVPSLSSRYPAMEEIDERFGLNLTWMDASEPSQMARQLKGMEAHAHVARSRLPTKTELAGHAVENVAREYWKTVRECL